MEPRRSHAATGFLQKTTTRISLVVGSASIAWCAYVLPVMWAVIVAKVELQATLLPVIGTDPSYWTALEPELRASERANYGCPAALQNVAFIRVRLAEQALADGVQLQPTRN
jgi:hypothetical protein